MPTHQLISSTVANTSTAYFQFNSITSGFTDLCLIISSRITGAGDPTICL